MRPDQRDGLSAVFAYVEDMPPSVFAESVPWSWTTFPEYLDALRALPCTVNVDKPAAVGVPEIVPSVPSVKPDGSAPVVTVQVTFDGTPWPSSLNEYGEAAVAGVSAVVAIPHLRTQTLNVKSVSALLLAEQSVR